MRFEKWHALGNDYVIVEAEQLPFGLTPARIRALCAPHTGISSDGILLLSAPTEPGYVARLQIFNPDGSEAELSGNGAREAIMYLRRHGTATTDTFSIQTAAGEIRPTITGPRTAAVDMGRVRLHSSQYPNGADDGRGTLETDDGAWAFQYVEVGNPQCAISVPDEATLHALDLPAVGPGIENHPLFPQRTNVSWYTPLAPEDGGGRAGSPIPTGSPSPAGSRIRARIFERGVGETAASGTGATGAAVAHVLAGGDSPVTVMLDGGELTVEVGEDLHVTLSGWAVPVYAGALADDFIKELEGTNETE